MRKREAKAEAKAEQKEEYGRNRRATLIPGVSQRRLLSTRGLFSPLSPSQAPGRSFSHVHTRSIAGESTRSSSLWINESSATSLLGMSLAVQGPLAALPVAL